MLNDVPPPSGDAGPSSTPQSHADELAAEQAYIDHAYACLDRTREAASAMASTTELGPGGTFQARFERDVIAEQMTYRLSQLHLGDQSLIFGRIDSPAPIAEGGETESFYIGRLAVANETQDPVVVDWRAPIAEAFYRATGRDPMGLVRRRHFTTRGQTLIDVDDELFGAAAQGLDDGTVQGEGALIAALESSRSGKLSDIVATIQGEQDEVIRSPLPGVLIVQGGPGTGKTVVALHRAAYLLYTHRFPLDGQGVLVIGPNRLFLSYIEQVLPSLGEAGVEISVLGDLVPHVRSMGLDEPAVARVKGELRMCRLIARAIRNRQRQLPRVAEIPCGVEVLRVSPIESGELIAAARRRSRTHNGGRRHLENAFFELLASKMREPIDAAALRGRVRDLIEVREALERMWPVLTAGAFLNDLLGSSGLLHQAGRPWFSDHELELLSRPRVADWSSIVWTSQDVPLLDEALELLGPRRTHKEGDAIRTYGHIVVDEAQDLSPMELRVIDRRSLNGSMTIVGDIAQATGAHAHDSWDSVLEHLPDRREPRFAELTTGYRLPAPSMELASRVLRVAAPGLRPPTSVRRTGDDPIITASDDDRFSRDLAVAIERELSAVGAGNLAVIVPGAWLERVASALDSEGVDYGRATRGTLDHRVTLTPVHLVKGLELDACVVVEPSAILDHEYRGAQALYVALTRATKRLTVMHVGPLPAVLAAHD